MRFIAVCFLLASCAAPGARFQDAMQLAPGAPVAAPEGLADYCLRTPGDCGEAVRTGLRGRIPATGAASFQAASFNTNRSDTSVFDALMAARTAPRQLGAWSSSSRMPLTEERWQELRQVNRGINRAIRPMTDRAAFGVEEYWQRPLVGSGRGARGDCEDFALEKRARLLALGWSPEMLAMAVAVAPRIGLHATLVVQTDRGDFVLDNLHDEPRALGELDYVWISRQVGASLTNWATADVMTSPGVHYAADVSPEAMFERLMSQRTSADAASVVHVQAPPAPTAVHTTQSFVATPAPGAPQPRRDGAPWKPSVLAGGAFMREGMEHIAP